MARFLRLIAVLVALGVAPDALAVCTKHPSAYSYYCDDQGEAYAVVMGIPPRYPDSNPGPTRAVAATGYPLGEWAGAYNHENTYPNGEKISNGGAQYRNPLNCDARNSDPEQSPGSRLSLATDTGSKCVGGCVLDIVGDPLEVVQGRVQGQPAVFYRFAQEYTGEVCLGQEADPEFNNEDDFEPDEQDPDRQCNPTAGICVNDDGDTEYCIFDSNGNPTSCREAIDYDEDGIDDDNDTLPDDPTNGEDDGDGDESDNSASGGAKCPHAGGQPPVCKGDAIQCNALLQAYINRCWNERAAAAKVEGGIACSATEALKCTNMSPMECYLAAQARKTSCAAEGIVDALSGAGGEEPLEPPDLLDAWADGNGGNGDGTGSGDGFEVDDSGWLSSRSCPTIPSVSVFGRTVSFSTEVGRVCDFFSITSGLVLLFAGFWAARIIGET